MWFKLIAIGQFTHQLSGYCQQLSLIRINSLIIRDLKGVLIMWVGNLSTSNLTRVNASSNVLARQHTSTKSRVNTESKKRLQTTNLTYPRSFF